MNRILIVSLAALTLLTGAAEPVSEPESRLCIHYCEVCGKEFIELINPRGAYCPSDWDDQFTFDPSRL